MESIRAFTGNFKSLSGFKNIYSGIVSEVRWERAERQLDFQIPAQRLEFVRPPGGLFILRARCERESEPKLPKQSDLCHLSSLSFHFRIESPIISVATERATQHSPLFAARKPRIGARAPCLRHCANPQRWTGTRGREDVLLALLQPIKDALRRRLRSRPSVSQSRGSYPCRLGPGQRMDRYALAGQQRSQRLRHVNAAAFDGVSGMTGKGASPARDRLLTMAPLERFSNGRTRSSL